MGQTPPEITAITPGAGSPLGGEPVSIIGLGFSGTTAVSFGDSAVASFQLVSDSELLAITPAGNGTVQVTVTTDAGTSPSSPQVQFSYGTLQVAVVRPDDLLALRFELINLTLQPGRPPQLVRTQADADAFIVVHFPPQHVAEFVFTEQEDSTVRLPDPPIASVMAGESRLAFGVPVGAKAIPLTLAELLDWTKYTFLVTDNARVRRPLEPSEPFPSPAEPSPTQTAIEVPYRVVLSPDSTAVWEHEREVFVHEGRAALWHTRLVTRGGGSASAVRAIWTPDFASSSPFGLDDEFTLTSDVHRQLVRLTSDFAIPMRGGIFFAPSPLQTERLMLSALGAWVDVGGTWNPPDLSDVDVSFRLDLEGWRHVTAMGRDQSVRVVHRGFLLPFGHAASQVEVSERKLERTPDGTDVEVLARRKFLVVTQPTRDYTTPEVNSAFAHRGHELPFRNVRITTLVTPAADEDVSQTNGFLFSGKQRFHFHLVAQDVDEQLIDFDMPLRFVEDDRNIIPLDEDLRRADLKSQMVAFAPGTGDHPGGTHVKTLSMLFDVESGRSGVKPAFLPRLERAEVTVAAIERLLGPSGAEGRMSIEYHTDYLEHGFGPAEVFAQAVGAQALPLRFPDKQGGGIATPNMSLNGLSRSLGAVPQVEELAAGRFDPASVFDAADAKLLGSIRLKDLLAPLLDGVPFDPGQVPKLITRTSPDEVETSFSWRPKVARLDGTPLVTTDATTLEIDVHTHTKPRAQSVSSVIDGKLEHFALNFADVVRVDFDSLHFHTEQGKKDALDVQGIHIEFMGALAILDQLAALLPDTGFADGAFLEVTPAGLTTGYSLGLPTVGVGVFSLENILLSVKLELPFTGAPARLFVGFSEAAHPFLVTFSMIGGGGSLVIGLNAGGIEVIEGALALGGNFTVSLVIVEANVHANLGLAFAYHSGQLEFTAFLRIGGSVDLLGLISLSVELYLGLTLTLSGPDDPPDQLGTVGGRASLTVGVHLLFISKSFTLTLERNFPIPKRSSGAFRNGVLALPHLDGTRFEDMVSLEDWQAYCEAFA